MIDGITMTRELLVACVEDDPVLACLHEECLTAAGHTGGFTRWGAEAVRRFG